MLFQTPTFELFLVLVVAIATLLDRRAKAHQLFLLLASWAFYMAWDARFLGLILFSTVLDYLVGDAIHRSDDPQRRKWLLATSVVGNLSVLGLFKYHDFFAENLNALLAHVGLDLSIPLLHLILPVGISFYTFQTLSYTIDIYRGVLEPRKSFVKFALFVAFFPQLIAGPIVRARQFLPQLDRGPRYTDETSGSAIYLILKGLIKKVLFADVIASFLVNPVFADPASHTGLWVLLSFYGFKFQIYGDFSGYADIAIGSGRLLGYELPANFRSPYKASSFTDFWRRWHITMGSWFRDYVFFPLGGSRVSLWRGNLNVLITLLLVGLWHGAAWTFILWGGMHALFLIIERIFQAKLGRRDGSKRFTVLRVLVVFHLTTFATWVFRAPNVATLSELSSGARLAATGLETLPWGAWLAFALAIVTHFLPEDWKSGAERTFARAPATFQALAVVTVLLLIRIVGRASAEPFYYFQF